nr:transposase domain-containing protein [Novosphingobium kunmingense]
MVETCKMLDVEPYAYLSDVLARIITRSDTDPIDGLLPYNWVDTNAGQIVFEMSNIATAA